VLSSFSSVDKAINLHNKTLLATVGIGKEMSIYRYDPAEKVPCPVFHNTLNYDNNNTSAIKNKNLTLQTKPLVYVCIN